MNSINPTAVSIASGIGVTDRCLGEAGFKILVANDLSQKAEQIYVHNHSYENATDNPAFVRGDFTNQNIVNEIIEVARERLNGQSLDLLTAFFPPECKNEIGLTNNFIKNLIIICTQLQPKIVIIDQTRTTEAELKSRFTKYINENNDFPYVYSCQKYALNDHGIPTDSSTTLSFIVHQIFLKTIPISNKNLDLLDFTLPKQPMISIKEALDCVWGNNDETDKADITLIPLHVNVIKFSVEDQQKLVKLISPIKQGEYIHRKIIKNGRTHSKREVETKPFTRKVSSRADEGPFWEMHPKFHRGYTFFELALLTTLSDIPYEISPNGVEHANKVITKIADVTAPRFLLAIFKKAIGYLTKQHIEPLKLNKKYPSLLHKNMIIYLGSDYSPKPSFSKLDSFIAESKENATYYSYGYRDYLNNLICKETDMLVKVHPENQHFILIKNALTFDIAKRRDPHNGDPSMNTVASTKNLQIGVELLELLTTISSEELQDPQIINFVGALVEEGGALYRSKEQKQTNILNFFYDKIKKLNTCISTLKTLLCRSNFECKTVVLSFSDWKIKYISEQQFDENMNKDDGIEYQNESISQENNHSASSASSRVMPILTPSSSTIMAGSNEKVTYYSYGYRDYLYNLICKKTDLLVKAHPNTPAFILIKNTLTFNLFKNRDRHDDDNDSNTFTTMKNALQICVELLELLTTVSTEELQDPRIINPVETLVGEGGVFYPSKEKRRANFSDFLFRNQKKLNIGITTLKDLLGRCNFECKTRVLSFSDWKTKYISQQQFNASPSDQEMRDDETTTTQTSISQNEIYVEKTQSSKRPFDEFLVDWYSTNFVSNNLKKQPFDDVLVYSDNMMNTHT